MLCPICPFRCVRVRHVIRVVVRRSLKPCLKWEMLAMVLGSHASRNARCRCQSAVAGPPRALRQPATCDTTCAPTATGRGTGRARRRRPGPRHGPRARRRAETRRERRYSYVTLPSGNASFLQTHRKKRENASWPRQEPARPQGRGPSRCRQSAQDAAYHLDVDSSRVCRENYPRPCTPHPWRTRFPAPLCCACVAKLLPTHEPPLDSSDVRQSICTRS
jgi:hypothetical protein